MSIKFTYVVCHFISMCILVSLQKNSFMKYFISTLALIFMSNVVISQQNIESEEKNTLEGGLNIQNFNTITPTFRYRRIVSNKFSLRAGFEIDYNQQKDNFFEDEAGNLGLTGTYTQSNSLYTLSLGFAYHLKGNDRISPYIGIDLLGGYGFSSETGLNSDGSVFINDYELYRNGSTLLYGTRLLFGMDYYFYKNAFVGFETGLNFSNKNIYGINEAITIAGTTVNTYENAYSNSLLNSSRLLIRVGFRF